MNDLKLWVVRPLIVQVLSGILLLASAGYILQADDSVRLAPAPLVPRLVFTGQYSTGSREFYSIHQSIVPFGRATLELPILMYHYVRTPPSRYTDLLGYNLSVSPAIFDTQMAWLATNGYHTVTFNDVRRYWNRIAPLPSKPVIITLDDGYQDLYSTAFPILRTYGFTAVAYIVSGFVGRKAYVTANEIMQMDQYGIEIAAHTVDHADLARSSASWLTYQLVASKRWLEQLLGHPVLDMAYPSGQFNQQTILAVERAGYYSATTEAYSVFHTQADRFAWTRVRVSGGEPMNLFIANLGPSMPTVTITRVGVQPTPVQLQQQT